MTTGGFGFSVQRQAKPQRHDWGQIRGFEDNKKQPSARPCQSKEAQEAIYDSSLLSGNQEAEEELMFTHTTTFIKKQGSLL